MTDQISAQEFLKESSLFSLSSLGFIVDFAVKVKDCYSFYIPNFFSRNTNSDEKEMENVFEKKLREFIANYLIEWFKYMKTKKNGIDNEDDFLRKVSAVEHDISKNKIFAEVVLQRGRKMFEVSANKSCLNIMRFGNCLGVGFESEHKSGVAAIEALRTNMNNMFRPQIFMESISSWIPLSGRRESNSNDEIIDLYSIIDQLKTSLPGIIFHMKGEIVEGIIQAYKESGRKEFCVGNYCGITVYARITHGENLDRTNIRSANYCSNDARIWREGNVQNYQDREHKFKDPQDLALVLSVRNSLPSRHSIDSIDDNFDNHAEQRNMMAVAAMINTQLRCMMMRSFLDSQRKQK